MSVNTYTTSDLISLIKQLGHVPQSDSTFTPANLLVLADLELRTAIAKQLKESNEGFLQTYLEYDQNSTGEYAVPSGAIAAGLFAVQIRDGEAIWPVSRQEVGEMTTTTMPSVSNYAFFIRGNTIHVLPAAFSGVLRVTYERRPSKLVTTTQCGQITDITGQDVTVSALPSGWVVGSALDLQQSSPQFDLLGAADITAINGLVLTLDGDLTDLSVGDYLCLEDQTCVPQVPVEFHQLLAQRVVCKIYESQGYLDKLKAAKAVLQEMEDSLTAVITPRTQSSPKVINPSWGGRKPGGYWSKFNPPAGRASS